MEGFRKSAYTASWICDRFSCIHVRNAYSLFFLSAIGSSRSDGTARRQRIKTCSGDWLIVLKVLRKGKTNPSFAVGVP